MARRSVVRKTWEDEDSLAKAVAEFLRLALPSDVPFWHCPNGGKREQKTRIDRRSGKTIYFSPEAQKLKAMGVLPGVPDLTFILPTGQAAFIELKVGTNDLSDEQVDLRDRLVAARCGYAVCRSVEDVEETVRGWLSLFGRTLRATAGPLFGSAA